MLKKRTFFVSGFLLEQICGFFQNFFQTYLGSSNIFNTIFYSPRCNRLEMPSVLVQICQIFFLVFCIFLAPNVKIRKKNFSKIFRSLLRASTDIATLVLTLFVFAQSCPKNRDGSKHWLLEVNPSHPHDHGFLLFSLRSNWIKNPLSRLGCVVNFLSF